MFDFGLGTWIKLGLVIAIIAVIGGAWARYEYVVHEWHSYQQKYKDEQRSHEEDRKNWEQQVAKWNSEKSQLETALASMKQEKQSAVHREFEMFQVSQKKVIENQKRTDNEIKAASKPDDMVTVPDWFVSVYNDAVEGSGITGEGSRDSKVASKGRPFTVDQIDTFDATTFAQVLKGNVDKYNQLAIRCDALIDTVKAQEAVDEKFNSGGNEGGTSQAGGNVPAGATTN